MSQKSDQDGWDRKIDRMVDRMAGERGPGRKTDALAHKMELHARINNFTASYNDGIITEPSRDIPVLDRCEVLVVGGGPAGISAALSARRAGADVIVCERYGCFGGVITTVGMETIGWYRYEGTVEGEGIGIEMERLAARMGGTLKWPYNESQCLDADFFKVVADHLIRESGIRPILHCLAVEVIKDGNCIKGIITESKSGRQAILAKRVVDCTGDADIAYMAGAPYTTLPKNNRLALTTVFSCSGVVIERFLDYTEKSPATYADWSRNWEQETTGKEDVLRSPYLEKEFEDAKKEGLVPQDAVDLCGSWSALSPAGEATNLNLVHLENYDGTDVKELTRAEMEGRVQGMHALTALKHKIPGFEKAKLRNFGSTIGVRDTRKIVGRHNLTADEVRNQAKFDDAIGIFPEFIDGYAVLILPTTGRYFQVPYGCMLPQGVENLLVAGRCVAGDPTSHAAMRNMMACTVTGQIEALQGAGCAAAVSVKSGKPTSEVDAKCVQEELRKQGVRIE